jgi:UDP-N-acetylglucosamine--N-acetylmuramyl-(pentapeptide) pyrophosphoryl-undecaprenol N-acetylglucosamine transferase
MNILFVGGGSLGPVTPLLATAKALRRLAPKARFSWIGTPSGPERAFVEEQEIPFYALRVVKIPRYPSFAWLALPFNWMRVMMDARRLIDHLKPDVVVGAGGFTSVPVMTFASRRGIPCATHQLDLAPGLANRQVAKLCKSVTTSFEYERGPFGRNIDDERIATPTRFRPEELPSQKKAAASFGFSGDKPIVLVIGGGTGSKALNEMVWRSLGEWVKIADVLHVTGLGKNEKTEKRRGYVVREVLLEKEAQLAYAAADLLVSRGGLGTLSEATAALAKPTIAVPIPGAVDQSANVRAFEEQGALIVVLQEDPAFDKILLETASLLLHDKEGMKAMGEKAHMFLPTDDGTELAKKILGIIKKK